MEPLSSILNVNLAHKQKNPRGLYAGFMNAGPVLNVQHYILRAETARVRIMRLSNARLIIICVLAL